MNKHQIITQQIKSDGFLPLFYHPSASICIAIVKALYEGGVRCIEFTNRGENALSNFKELLQLKKQDFPDLLLGIGTIKNEQEAEAYTQAGADFLISPCFDQKISGFANEANMLWMPGCMTPSEINAASNNGHKFIKLFPGNVLQAQFISAIKPVFADVDFMVTGGVTNEIDNLKTWFKAGAVAVGLGRNLIRDSWQDTDDFSVLRKDAASLRQKVQTARAY